MCRTASDTLFQLCVLWKSDRLKEHIQSPAKAAFEKSSAPFRSHVSLTSNDLTYQSFFLWDLHLCSWNSIHFLLPLNFLFLAGAMHTFFFFAFALKKQRHPSVSCIPLFAHTWQVLRCYTHDSFMLDLSSLYQQTREGNTLPCSPPPEKKPLRD